MLSELSSAPYRDVLVSHFSRGKMLRAGLVFTSTAAVGAQPERVLPAAVCLELLHGASLIHDDIVDGSAERRGLPAVHHRVPAGAGLVLGDYLIFRSLTALGRAVSTHDLEAVFAANRLVQRHAEDCCRGQVEDLGFAGAHHDEEQYLALVRRKTASLFILAATIGPVLAGVPDDAVRALESYACATGVAFQINDDLLDLLADANDADLNDGDRRTRRRPSLPLLYLERSGSPKGLARLHAWRRLKGPPGEITQLLLDEGVLSLVRATQQRLTDAAIHALEGLEPSEARTALDAFTRSLTEGVQAGSRVGHVLAK